MHDVLEEAGYTGATILINLSILLEEQLQDGDACTMLKERANSIIKSLPIPSDLSSSLTYHRGMDIFYTGDVVEVLFDEEDVFYGGRIVENNEDGTYEVQQEWGGEIETVSGKWIFRDQRKVVYKDDVVTVIDGHMVDKGQIIDARFMTFSQSPQLYQTAVAVNSGQVFKLDGKRFNWSLVPFDVNQGFVLSLAFLNILSSAGDSLLEPSSKYTPKIAVLGCGGGIVPSVINNNFPHVAIDIVELAPSVLSAAKNFFGLKENDMVKTTEGDALVWLSSSHAIATSYDIIMVDVAGGEDFPFLLPPLYFF
jgi:hypothetical protein